MEAENKKTNHPFPYPEAKELEAAAEEICDGSKTGMKSILEMVDVMKSAMEPAVEMRSVMEAGNEICRRSSNKWNLWRQLQMKCSTQWVIPSKMKSALEAATEMEYDGRNIRNEICEGSLKWNVIFIGGNKWSAICNGRVEAIAEVESAVEPANKMLSEMEAAIKMRYAMEAVTEMKYEI